jgi:hypothetical protein
MHPVTSTIAKHSFCSPSLVLSIIALTPSLNSFISGRVGTRQSESLRVRVTRVFERAVPKEESSC